MKRQTTHEQKCNKFIRYCNIFLYGLTIMKTCLIYFNEREESKGKNDLLYLFVSVNNRMKNADNETRENRIRKSITSCFSVSA